MKENRNRKEMENRNNIKMIMKMKPKMINDVLKHGSRAGDRKVEYAWGRWVWFQRKVETEERDFYLFIYFILYYN